MLHAAEHAAATRCGQFAHAAAHISKPHRFCCLFLADRAAFQGRELAEGLHCCTLVSRAVHAKGGHISARPALLTNAYITPILLFYKHSNALIVAILRAAGMLWPGGR